MALSSCLHLSIVAAISCLMWFYFFPGEYTPVVHQDTHREEYSWVQTRAADYCNVVHARGSEGRFSGFNLEDFSLLHVSVLARHGARVPIHNWPNSRPSRMDCFLSRDDTLYGVKDRFRVDAAASAPTRRVFAERVMPFYECQRGDLTQLGYMQHFSLGQHLRNAYVDAEDTGALLPLSMKKAKSQIRVISTDFPRTALSAAALMLGLYPPETWKTTKKLPIKVVNHAIDGTLLPVRPHLCPPLVGRVRCRQVLQVEPHASVFSDLMEGFGIRPGTPTSVIDYGFIYGGTSDDEERADLLRRCHNALNCTIMHELDEAAVKKLWGKETVYPDEDAVGPFRAVKHAAYPLPSAVHLTDDVLCRVCHAKQLPCAAHAPVYCDHADPEGDPACYGSGQGKPTNTRHCASFKVVQTLLQQSDEEWSRCFNDTMLKPLTQPLLEEIGRGLRRALPSHHVFHLTPSQLRNSWPSNVASEYNDGLPSPDDEPSFESEERDQDPATVTTEDHTLESMRIMPTTSSTKFVLRLAHDTTLAPVLGALGYPHVGWPPFASRIVFELWYHHPSDQSFVRVLYQGKDITSDLECYRIGQPAHGMCRIEDFQISISRIVQYIQNTLCAAI